MKSMQRVYCALICLIVSMQLQSMEERRALTAEDFDHYKLLDQSGHVELRDQAYEAKRNKHEQTYRDLLCQAAQPIVFGGHERPIKRVTGYYRAEYDWGRLLEKDGKIEEALDMYYAALRDSRVAFSAEQKTTYDLTLKRVEDLSTTNNVGARVLLAAEYLRGYCGSEKRKKGFELLDKLNFDPDQSSLPALLTKYRWQLALDGIEEDEIKSQKSPYYAPMSMHMGLLREYGVIFKQDHHQAALFYERALYADDINYKQAACERLQRLATAENPDVRARGLYMSLLNKKNMTDYDVSEAIRVLDTLLDDVQREQEEVIKPKLVPLLPTIRAAKLSGKFVTPVDYSKKTIGYIESVTGVKDLIAKLSSKDFVYRNTVWSVVARYKILQAQEIKYFGGSLRDMVMPLRSTLEMLEAKYLKLPEGDIKKSAKETLSVICEWIVDQWVHGLKENFLEADNAFIMWYLNKAEKYDSDRATFEISSMRLDMRNDLTDRGMKQDLKRLEKIADTSKNKKLQKTACETLIRLYQGEQLVAHCEKMKDLVKAEQYAQKAMSDHQSLYGEFRYGTLLYDKGQQEKGLRHIQNAANGGHGEAQNWIERYEVAQKIGDTVKEVQAELRNKNASKAARILLPFVREVPVLDFTNNQSFVQTLAWLKDVSEPMYDLITQAIMQRIATTKKN